MKKINRFNKKERLLIEDFIHSIDNTLKVKVSKNKMFECDIPKKTIYIGIKNVDKRENELFIEWLKTLPEYQENINRRILSILHEIGHFKTYNEQEFQERQNVFSMLTFMYEQDVIDYKEYGLAYWNMTNEKKATLWGLNFYKTHKKECNNLVKLLGLAKFN